MYLNQPANSESTILSHSLAVMNKADNYFSNYFNSDEETRERVLFVTLFHDIGKVLPVFQKQLKGELKSNYLYPHHNEVAWAFIIKKIQADDEGAILDSLYFSHRTYVYNTVSLRLKEKYYFSSANEILSFISSEDLEILEKVYLELLSKRDWKYINFRRKDSTNDYSTPTIFNYKCGDFNDTLIIRSILFTADRLVSKDIEESSNDLDFSITINEDYKYRFESEQKPIIDSIKNKTAIIKAPTGYGKTLMGLYWIHKYKQKTIWVCPDNNTATSVYNNILTEIKCNNINISVELFLSSSVVSSTDEGNNYSSDIIVTNIDNYYFSLYKSHMLEYAINMFNRNIIFDEYHSLSDSPRLYSLFLRIMQIRSSRIKCNTLLLSATPSWHHNLFISNKTNIDVLPSNDEHFKSFNKTKFACSLKNIDELYTPEKKSGCVYFFNTIKQVQQNYLNSNLDLLLHSRYTDEDKYKILTKIYEYFGKNTMNNVDKSFITSFIGEKAMDVSYSSGEITLFSFESILQRLGRISRWGEYTTTDIKFLSPEMKSSSSEAYLWKGKYNKNFKPIIDTFFKENIADRVLTINDFYSLYNAFNIDNKSNIIEYLNSIKKEGEDTSNTIFFRKYEIDESRKGKSLRSSTDNYNYYVYNTNNEFTKLNVNSGDFFIDKTKKVAYTRKRLERFLKEVDSSKLERFLNKKFNERKELTDNDIDEWVDKSKIEEFPFMDLLHQYCSSTDSKIGIGLNFKEI